MFKKRAVFNQLTVLIKCTHLLSGKISSSRETHSSSTLLLSTRDDTKAKKQGRVTLIFLWNLSKAFIPWNTEPSYIKWANLDFPNHSLKQQLITFITGKKCIFQYGKSLENSMFEYPTLDNHWEIYSVPIKVQLFSNTGKMLFIHDLAAGVSLEVYWRTTHLVFQCWTMM